MDVVFIDLLVGAMQTKAAALTGDQHVMTELSEEYGRQFGQSLALCACENSGVGTPVCLTIQEILGMFGTFAWILDDALLGGLDALYTDAYADMTGPGPGNR